MNKPFDVIFDEKVGREKENLTETESPQDWAENLVWINEQYQRHVRGNGLKKISRYSQLIAQKRLSRAEWEEFLGLRQEVIEMLAEIKLLTIFFEGEGEKLEQAVPGLTEFKTKAGYLAMLGIVSAERLSEFMALDQATLERALA